MKRVARDTVAVSTQSCCEARAAPRQGSYVKVASCWRVLRTRCHVRICPVAHERRFSRLPQIEGIPLFVRRDTRRRNGAHPMRRHAPRTDRMRVVYGHLALLVENRSATLGHLPFQRVAGQCLRLRTFPDKAPEIVIAVRALAGLN